MHPLRSARRREGLFRPGILSVTAIELTRLRTQIAGLMAAFTDPEAFVRRLCDLLEYYTDHTYRPTPGGRTPIVPHFKVPAQVLRQIEGELAQRAQQQPEEGLRLADALWANQYLEPRELAAWLLGSLPREATEAVMARLNAWAQPTLDATLLIELLQKGGVRVLRDEPERWLALVEGWLGSDERPVQAMGLRALLPLVEDVRFENLPQVFRLLTPLVSAAPAELLAEMTALMRALARRSPAETAYFLRQTLAAGRHRGVRRLVRNSLAAFPEEAQRSLRAALLAYPQEE